MPGIVGLISKNREILDVGPMQRAIRHSDGQRLCSPAFAPPFASALVSAPGPRSTSGQHSQNEIHVLVYGEIQDATLNYPENSARYVYDLYTADLSMSFLRELNGSFSIVIHDADRGLTHLISDRLGTRHFYYANRDHLIAWGSEIKAFAAIPRLDLTLNKTALRSYLRIGHPDDNDTWFNEVTLLAPASILTIDSETFSTRTHAYWSWNEIQETGHDPEICDLFQRAVSSQCSNAGEIAITLSGGLDSRAILAAVPRDLLPAVTCITYGVESSQDIAIAKQVTKNLPCRHEVITVAPSFDATTLLDGVWWTDAHLPVNHCTGMLARDAFSRCDVHLCGFLGDAFLGGSYLKSGLGLEAHYMGRGRRFIAYGLRQFDNMVYTRIPFFEDSLLLKTLGLPRDALSNSAFYRRMLLDRYPAFFSSIKWLSTNAPISATPEHERLSALYRRGVNFASSRLIGRPLMEKQYARFDLWMRSRNFISLTHDYLAHDPTVLEVISRPDLLFMLKEFKERGDHLQAIARMISFEYWLRRFRNI